MFCLQSMLEGGRHLLISTHVDVKAGLIGLCYNSSVCVSRWYQNSLREYVALCAPWGRFLPWLVLLGLVKVSDVLPHVVPNFQVGVLFHLLTHLAVNVGEQLTTLSRI